MPQVIRLLALALLVAGCGSEATGSPAVPGGFPRLDGPGYTLAHPAGWQPLNTADSRGVQGPKGTGGLAPQAVVGHGKITAPLDLSVQGLEADNRIRRAGYRVVHQAPYHVAGASGARLVEARLATEQRYQQAATRALLGAAPLKYNEHKVETARGALASGLSALAG